MKGLAGKTILVVEGSLLSGSDLRRALEDAGATICLTSNEISAYGLIDRLKLDAAAIDQALHNEAFELCSELRLRGVPYICCNTPHRLQGTTARQRAGEVVASKLARLLSDDSELEPSAGVLYGFSKNRFGKSGGGFTDPHHN